jgi:DNA mismatch repair protein MutS2
VGLIQLLFQSGLHVPVSAGTELPCLEGVFADIGDEQSLSQSLSTFSGHVRNIVQILRRAGPRILVLLDELGAGTDPAEGAALGQAILDRLLAQGALSMVTTHLGVLKAYAFARPDVENACVTFDADTLRPTFRLVVGQPGTSQALLIAERHGLDPAVVGEARHLLESEKDRAHDLMNDLLNSRVAAEEARMRSEQMARESEARLRDAEVALKEAESERERVEREAESEVQRVLDRLVAEARPHVNALKNVPKSLVPDIQALEALLYDRTRMMPFAERRRAFLKDLRKHDLVYVPRFGQVCRIERLNRSEERLSVRLGAVSMEIGFDDVSWLTPPEAPKGTSGAAS